MKIIKKLINYTLCTIMMSVFYSCCEQENNNEYELEQFRGLKPPVIVVSKGTILGGVRIVLRDSCGTVIGFNDEGFESAVKGDTLIYAN